MEVEMSDSNEELIKRIAALEGELAALKAQLPQQETYERKDWPRFDPSEGLRAPMSALKPMVDLVRDAKDLKYDPNAWARTRLAQPGGFGGPVEPSGAKRVERGGGWRDQAPLEPMIKGRWSK
jgi:hypothetical protein